MIQEDAENQTLCSHPRPQLKKLENFLVIYDCLGFVKGRNITWPVRVCLSSIRVGVRVKYMQKQRGTFSKNALEI